MARRNGSDRDDVINGTSRDDVIHGNGGDDTISGSFGDDQLFGDDGDDTLIAGYDRGNGDLFDGGDGNDTYRIDGSQVDHFAFDVNRGGPGCLNSKSALLSGSSAVVMLPCGSAAR